MTLLGLQKCGPSFLCWNQHAATAVTAGHVYENSREGLDLESECAIGNRQYGFGRSYDG